MMRILFFLAALGSVSCVTGGRFSFPADLKDRSSCCGNGKAGSRYGEFSHGERAVSVKGAKRRLHSVAGAKSASVPSKDSGAVGQSASAEKNALSPRRLQQKNSVAANSEPSRHTNSESSAKPSEKKAGVLNRVIEDLSFSPVNGPGFRLSDLKNREAVVIAMRERDCPISAKYSPRLVRLEREYSPKGVSFIYNYVGQVRPRKNGAADLKDHGFKGAYVIDREQAVVRALSAKTTGDVFVLTPERKVIYRGPVDDQYHLLKSALKPKNNYVADVLTAIVSGKKITPKELPAPGCLISRPLAETKS